MWKYVVMAVVLMFCMTGASALELTVGPDLDFTINKELKCKNLGAEADYSAQYYDVKADVKLGDIITLSPKAGINTFSLTPDIKGIGEVEANGGIGWNVGLDAEAKLLKTEYVDLSLAGEYRYSRTDIDEIGIGGIVIDNPIETILATHEWEVGLFGSKDLSQWTGLAVKPYLGVVYSDLKGRAEANLSVISLKENISAKNHLGIRTGFTVAPIENLNVGLGVKLVDETAITGSLTYRF